MKIEDIKAQILAADDLQLEAIDLPTWGSPPVFVRVMTGTERDNFEQSMIDQRGKSFAQNLANIRAKLAALCLVNASGERVFTDAEIEQLGGKSSVELNRIFEVARRLNHLSNGDIDELAKN